MHARKKALTDKGGFDYAPTEEELTSFAEIKEWISDPEKGVLALPDFESPFYLLCDAANTVGMGVIVAQWRDGRMRTVAYYSRQWKTAESRWHSLEHECCTVYEGIRRFSNWLHAKFYIETDAEPLVWLRNVKRPKGKYATWTMEMQCYDWTITHNPARDHRGPDALSRLASVLPAHVHGRMAYDRTHGTGLLKDMPAGNSNGESNGGAETSERFTSR